MVTDEPEDQARLEWEKELRRPVSDEEWWSVRRMSAPPQVQTLSQRIRLQPGVELTFGTYDEDKGDVDRRAVLDAVVEDRERGQLLSVRFPDDGSAWLVAEAAGYRWTSTDDPGVSVRLPEAFVRVQAWNAQHEGAPEYWILRTSGV